MQWAFKRGIDVGGGDSKQPINAAVLTILDNPEELRFGAFKLATAAFQSQMVRELDSLEKIDQRRLSPKWNIWLELPLQATFFIYSNAIQR